MISFVIYARRKLFTRNCLTAKSIGTTETPFPFSLSPSQSKAILEAFRGSHYIKRK